MAAREAEASVAVSGREEELAAAARVVLENRESAGDKPPILVIHGAGGMGKTTFANRLAQLLRQDFPDGVLYASFRSSLRAQDAKGRYDGEAADALGQFLRALGVPGASVPQDANERRGLFRSLTAGRRLLVVLDDVESDEMILPLLPSSAGSAVIATTRMRSRGIRTEHYAIVLGPLSREEAYRLLEQASGRQLDGEEARAATEIVDIAEGVPLAMQIATKMVRRAQPGGVLYVADAFHRALNDRSRASSFQPGIGAVLEAAYNSLAPSESRLLRWVSPIDAPSLSRGLIRKLAALAELDADVAIEGLTAAGLLSLGDYGHATLHPVVRGFARDRLLAEDGTECHRKLVAACLDWYVELAETNMAQVTGALGLEVSMNSDEGTTELSGAEWFNSEYRNMLVQVHQAAELGYWQQVWQLGSALADYFAFRQLWNEWVEVQELGLAAARNLSIPDAQSGLLLILGHAYARRGDYDDAAGAYTESLRISRAQRDDRGEARALAALGDLRAAQGRNEAAVDAYENVLPIVRRNGDVSEEGVIFTRLGALYVRMGRLDDAFAVYDQARQRFLLVSDNTNLAQVLSRLGSVHVAREQLVAAITCHEESLSLFREVGDRVAESQELALLAGVYARTGQLAAAIGHYERSLSSIRATGDRRNEAIVLNNLADVFADQGRTNEALAAYGQALDICQELGDRIGEVDIRTSIGRLFVRLDLYAEAAQVLEGAIDLSRTVDLGGRSLRAILTQLGAVYCRQLRWEEASAVMEEAIRLIPSDRKDELASALATIARAYVHSDRWSDGIRAFEESLSLWRGLGQPAREAETLGALGEAYESRDLFDEALPLYLRSIGVWRELGERVQEERDSLHAANLYERLGRAEEAADLRRVCNARGRFDS